MNGSAPTGRCTTFGTPARCRFRDKNLTLRDVQVILGHAHLTTTQVYLEEDDHEIIRRVHQHLTAQEEPTPRPSPAVVPDGYAEADLAVLLGEATR